MGNYRFGATGKVLRSEASPPEAGPILQDSANKQHELTRFQAIH